MERIDLPRGRWVRFARPVYITDMRAFSALAGREDMSLLDMMAAFTAILEPAVEERSWDGPFEQMTDDELVYLSRRWGEQSEQMAFPPANGTGSETA